MDVNGKVVLITGANSAIGTATALRFLKLGATVVLTDETDKAVADVIKACAFYSHDSPLGFTCDLASEKDIVQLAENVIKKFLTLDVLINNASVVMPNKVVDSDLKQFDKIFCINVRAVFYLTKLFLPYLSKAKGSIVNVTSVPGMRSFQGTTIYNMSKAAIDQFTNSLSIELAPDKVRVNSVCTGIIESDWHINIGMKKDDYRRQCKTLNALGRPGTPEEVANAIAFLASSQSSFITGANLTVDGGCYVNYTPNKE